LVLTVIINIVIHCADAVSKLDLVLRKPHDDDDVDSLPGASPQQGGPSYAPSMHPSLAGSVARSQACSESTIGAGDSTKYWDYQHRVTMRSDLGHKCRECRMPFSKCYYAHVFRFFLPVGFFWNAN